MLYPETTLLVERSIGADRPIAPDLLAMVRDWITAGGEEFARGNRSFVWGDWTKANSGKRLRRKDLP